MDDDEDDVAPAHREFAAAQLAEGVAPVSVRALLVRRGLDRAQAAVVVASVRGKGFEPRDQRSTPRRDLIVGGLSFAVGLLVTIGTYEAGGKYYVFAWGPMLFGIFRVIRGFGKLR